MDFSQRAVVNLCAMISQNLSHSKKELQEVEAFKAMKGIPFLAEKFPKDLTDESIEKTIKKKMIHLRDVELIHAQCLANIPGYDKAWEVDQGIDELLARIDKAVDWSAEELAIKRDLESYCKANHGWLAVYDEEKPWEDFGAYYKAWEEHNKAPEQ